jgi:hypothetical protein
MTIDRPTGRAGKTESAKEVSSMNRRNFMRSGAAGLIVTKLQNLPLGAEGSPAGDAPAALLSSSVLASPKSLDVTVSPVSTGQQLVRLSLNLPRGVVMKGQTVAASDGRLAVPTDLNILTWHKASQGRASVDSAWAAFLYDFKSTQPVRFSLRPVPDKAGSARENVSGPDVVQFMTPDLYYKNFHLPLTPPSDSANGDSSDAQFKGRIEGKKYRSDYKLCPEGLEITNGPNLFNRALYAPGCKAFLTAGDWPAFILWTNNHYKKAGETYFGNPDGFGYFYPGLSDGTTSKYFKDFDYCHTVYHPGWIEYHLRDKAFKGVEILFEVVPSEDGAMIVNLQMALKGPAAKECEKKLELVWTHGCLKNDNNSCWQGSYDIQSIDFPWDQSELADNDTLEFSNKLAVIRDSKDLDNWVAVGCNPPPYRLFAADATVRLKSAPDQIFDHPAGGKPVAAGRVRPILIGNNTLKAWVVLKWGRKSDPRVVMEPIVSEPEKYLANGKKYFKTRTERIRVKTPDPEFDSVFKFDTCAIDSMWHKPAINHGPYSWGGLTTIFRVYYGATCAGDHDRIASAFNYHCIPSDEGWLSNVSPSVESHPFRSGYESYGSTTDMLWHHYLWTGDKETLRQWKPMVDGMLKYEEKNRKDSYGLFKDHLGFWCSDSSNYEEGCAVGSTYVYQMYAIRAKMAGVFGEDPAPFMKRAEEIKSNLYRYLWNENEGFFCDSIMTDGQKLPSPIAPAIYHPIEYRMVDTKDGNRMFDWMVKRLTSVYGVVRVDDWYPISWSHNVYSPLETANAGIAAYKLRRGEIGYKMLKSVVNGALHEAVVPGSISCHASSTGFTTNGTDFGDGNSLFMRCAVEGLFGIDMNVPKGYVGLSPNFPEGWTHAEMSLPDVPIYRYKNSASGGNGLLSFELRLARNLSVRGSIPVPGNAKSVYVNSSPVKFVVRRYREMNLVLFETPASDNFQIKIMYAAPGKNVDTLDKDLQALTSEVQLIPASISMKSAGPLSRLSYEMVPLVSYETLPFNDVYKLYPGEQTWFMSDLDETWGCVWNSRFGNADHVSITSQSGVPFTFDRQNVVAIEMLHENAVWKTVAGKIKVPQTLTIEVNKPAEEVFMLLSGFSTPMTCYLPQIRIDLNYANGSTCKYELTSPYELDYVSQHTSVHPAESMGLFGKKSGPPGSVTVEPKDIKDRLHADVLHLKGREGLLKSITIACLQRQSGVALYGLTVATK